MSFPESTDVRPRPLAVEIQSQLVAYMGQWLTGLTGVDGTDYGTVPISISVPRPVPPFFVCLWRAGGRTAFPLIYERIYAPSTAARLDLAAQVHVGLLVCAKKIPSVLIATDESFPTEITDSGDQPVMFGSMSLQLLPY